MPDCIEILYGGPLWVTWLKLWMTDRTCSLKRQCYTNRRRLYSEYNARCCHYAAALTNLAFTFASTVAEIFIAFLTDTQFVYSRARESTRNRENWWNSCVWLTTNYYRNSSMHWQRIISSILPTCSVSQVNYFITARGYEQCVSEYI